MASYSGTINDDEVVTIYVSTNAGVRTVKTAKQETETIGQFKARHLAAIEAEMAEYPPLFE